MPARVLHIASFEGNMGDLFSHEGFYSIAQEIFGSGVSIQNIELRDFYFNKPDEIRRTFDLDTIRDWNQFDFVFVGGGGFLTPVFSFSRTGTTFDISDEALDAINNKWIWGSLGCKPFCFGDRPEKLISFIEKLGASKNSKLFLRLDGSLEYLGSATKNSLDLSTCFDHAFYRPIEPLDKLDALPVQEYVCINFASDQALAVAGERAQNKLRKFLSYFSKLGLSVKLMCHTSGDVEFASQILEASEGEHIGPIDIVKPDFSELGRQCFEDIYSNASLSIVQRYHAAIVAVTASNRPVIILDCWDRSFGSMAGLSMGELEGVFIVDFMSTNEDRVEVLVDQSLNHGAKRNLQKSIEKSREEYVGELRDFLEL